MVGMDASICRFCYQPVQIFQVSGGLTVPQICNKCAVYSGPAESFGQFLLPPSELPPYQIVQENSNHNNRNSSTKNSTSVGMDSHNKALPLDVDVIFNEEGTCPLCSKTFSKKSSLLTHIRNHSAERKFVCSFCNKGFTQAANLRNHERIHTNDRPYVCGDCGKTFTQITNLNNHRRLHTGERPFVCIEPECGRSFAQVTNLNNHMKTHHKVQQYCCNICPKKFTQVTSLNTHLQAHAGLVGFCCPRCPDKMFKQQSQLQSHMKSHGLSFPYECIKCDEKFHQPTHLDQHLKMHDEFKFKCDLCTSSFNQEDLLKKHQQRHLDGRYVKCPVHNCNEAFAIKQQLSKHLLSGHAHSELPLSKRSKKNHDISLASTSSGSIPTVHIISQQHIPLTTTPGRGRPKKNKDLINDLPTMVPLHSIKMEDNYRNFQFQYEQVAQPSRNSRNQSMKHQLYF
ncbi:hypothetical protein ACFFRR_001133 [Megaselia abdita]